MAALVNFSTAFDCASIKDLYNRYITSTSLLKAKNMSNTKRKRFRAKTLQQIQKTIPSICKLAGAVPTSSVAMTRDGVFFVTRTDANPDTTIYFTSAHQGMNDARVKLREVKDTTELVVGGKTGHVAKNSLNKVVYNEVIKQMSMRAVTKYICQSIKKNSILAENADHVLKQVGIYLGFPLDNAEQTCASEEKYKKLFALIVKPQDKERAKRIARRNVALAKRAVNVLKENPAATLKPI